MLDTFNTVKSQDSESTAIFGLGVTPSPRNLVLVCLPVPLLATGELNQNLQFTKVEKRRRSSPEPPEPRALSVHPLRAVL